jgi:hypothetical protein
MPSGAPLPRHGWKRTLCPAGGAHEWRPSEGTEMQAPLATCAYGCVTLLLFWPALVLLPLVYLASHVTAQKTGDRVCPKCGMLITHKARTATGGASSARHDLGSCAPCQLRHVFASWRTTAASGGAARARERVCRCAASLPSHPRACGADARAQGAMVRRPTYVPAVNPGTGRPNAEHGYLPPPALVLPCAPPVQVVGVPAPVAPVVTAVVPPPQYPPPAPAPQPAGARSKAD